MSDTSSNPVVLITGGARRIGACIARRLHSLGYNIALHHRNSAQEATALAEDLNQVRANSVVTVYADLNQLGDIKSLVDAAVAHWGRLDAVINNASSFYPTPLGSVTQEQWDDLLNSNLKAPFFIAQAAANALQVNHGCLINIADIYADRPLKDHPVYCAAKAGNVMLTKSLARELAPNVRVNGIAPGAILWPEQDDEQDDGQQQTKQQDMLKQIPLARQGNPEDIAKAVEFLLAQAPYITGQIITVDGGRSLTG